MYKKLDGRSPKAHPEFSAALFWKLNEGWTTPRLNVLRKKSKSFNSVCDFNDSTIVQIYTNATGDTDSNLTQSTNPTEYNMLPTLGILEPWG